MNINDLLRENIKSMKAYASARSEFAGQASVWLDANEHPFGSAAGPGLNRYPDPSQKKLKQRIGNMKNIDADHIFLGNGSDEPIDLLIRAFCEPARDHIIILPPTYGMYKVAADLNNVAVKQVGLSDNFDLNIPQILSFADKYTKLLFVCSPNNPTGNLAGRDQLVALLRSFNGIVVVDEAYIDFATPGSSMLPLLGQHSNLVILQTFSKAWTMAGLRLGIAFASRDIVEVLHKIKPPYNVNELTQQHVLEVLNKEHIIAGWANEIIALRRMLERELAMLSCVKRIFPSEANFLLVQVSDAEAIYAFLLKKRIVVRNRSGEAGCSNCLRITVGTTAENALLVQALKEFSRIK